ncbi:NAD-dependent epimerase/dehydratase family protein [Nocardioides euryhalodurans]|uniref:NAD-dependent epimerase/dehydratase family protein n=1 Tax=Nocardioides euryhalodurans TaxID=2518370 RepID=A0A4P7GHM8_9ACTN|nr:NAD-dependent epimerase/dehydratase family protein [Nocardioides euryhalodurans]QBR91179.1 NAD-dependent epimerase/dehydratase family protein [Nocardioides euryhalodurans]
MRVVVTGGAGFIGANLARLLVEQGDEVVVVDDLSTGFRSNLDGVDVELREGSILDATLLDAVVPSADAVVHLAAVPSVPRSVADPLTSHAANATGTLMVLDAARRSPTPPHVTVASSSSVYGANPELPKHEDLRCVPMSPYAVSKLATESYATAFAHVYGLETMPFRFFNVFGPLQAAGHAYAAVIPQFVSAALEGRPLPLDGDGTQSRDFTFVGTVVRVLAEAAHRRVTSPQPVNLAFGGSTTLQVLIGMLEERLGRPVELDRRPPRAGDVPHSQADPTRLLGLFPGVTPVPLEQGLDETIAWFVQERG